MKAATCLAMCCFGCTSLMGCASYTPDQVARPTDITIDKALTQTVTAFADAQAVAKARHVNMGVALCSMTINFNVTAAANKSGNLVLDATIKTLAPVNAGVGGTAEQDVGSSASRGNTVSLVFTSELCLPPNTSGAAIAAGIAGAKPNKGGPVATGATPVATRPSGGPRLDDLGKTFKGEDGEHVLLQAP